MSVMKRIVCSALMLLVIGAVSLLAPPSKPAVAKAPSSRPALHIGDPAPPLTIVKWLKGTPQTDLHDGQSAGG
jgi:hypothetical protein